MSTEVLGNSDVLRLSEEFNGLTNHQDSYVRSMGYYLLTGRKGSTLFEDDAGAKVIVAQHPHIEERLLVFPEINGNGSMTAKLLSELPVPENGIQLARYTDEDLAKLRLATSSLHTSKQILISEIEEDVLDWKYPVQILDTKKTSDLKGQSFEKLRNKFNKASSKLTIMPLSSPNALNAMRASLMFWTGAMIYAGRETGHSLTEFYDVLFRIVDAYPDMFGGFIVMEGNEPAGFTIWEKNKLGIANSLAALSRRSIKGMSEFQNIMACRVLADEGINFYNLGGSETEGLNQHKLEYQPALSIQLHSYEIKTESLSLKGISQKLLPKLV